MSTRCALVVLLAVCAAAGAWAGSHPYCPDPSEDFTLLKQDCLSVILNGNCTAVRGSYSTPSRRAAAVLAEPYTTPQ